MIVLSDTTPIISLSKINKLDLLFKMFTKVLVPSAVYDELTCNERFSDELKIIKNCDFIEKICVSDKNAVQKLKTDFNLDSGESEAIICAKEINANLLLMDEQKGRKIAQNHHISITGTIGILISAYENNFIRKDEILTYIKILKENHRFLSENLYKIVLDRINGDK